MLHGMNLPEKSLDLRADLRELRRHWSSHRFLTPETQLSHHTTFVWRQCDLIARFILMSLKKVTVFFNFRDEDEEWSASTSVSGATRSRKQPRRRCATRCVTCPCSIHKQKAAEKM